MAMEGERGQPEQCSDETIELLSGRAKVRRKDLARVLQAGLVTLGYDGAATELERESGGDAEPSDWREAERLAVREGKFEKAIYAAEGAAGSKERAAKAQGELIREETLELLASGSPVEAMKRLRKRVASLSSGAHPKAEEAAWFVMCEGRDELRAHTRWNGPGVESRRDAIARSRSLMPAGCVLPEGRLEHLLGQALQRQLDLADKFNDEPDALPLLTDIEGGQDDLPTVQVQALREHEDEVWQVAFSPCGRFLATACKDDVARVYRLAHGCEQREPPRPFPRCHLQATLSGHSGSVQCIAWSPCGELLATCGAGRRVKVWRVQNGELVKEVGRFNDVALSAIWLPNGEGLLAGGMDKQAMLFTRESIEGGGDVDPEPEATWRGSRPHDLAVVMHSSGRLRGAACCGEGCVKVWFLKPLPRGWNLPKEETIREREHSVCSIAATQCLTRLAVTLPTLEVKLWDCSACPLGQAPLQCFRAGQTPRQARFILRSCFGGLSEGFLATGGEDAVIYVWRRSSARLVAQLSGHTGSVNAVSWHPFDTSLLASASDDHSAFLWCSRTSLHYRRSDSCQPCD